MMMETTAEWGSQKCSFSALACFGYAQKYHALSAFGGGGFLIALVQLLKQSSQKPQGKMSWSGDATNNIIACFFSNTCVGAAATTALKHPP